MKISVIFGKTKNLYYNETDVQSDTTEINYHRFMHTCCAGPYNCTTRKNKTKFARFIGIT